ncbi:MAG TPA: alpha/beta hydrolase, partial [Streptosporangiaceae bacterium]
MSWRSWPTLNIARAHLAGQDGGAALAWQLALIAPGSVDHLVVLSAGHPVTFRRTLQQREKSWYMLLFLFPGIAERWLTEDNWANFRTWARHPDADEVICRTGVSGLAHTGPQLVPGQRPPESWVPPPPQLPPVQAATMGVWSTSDPARTEIQMTDSAQNVAGPWRYERLDGPGHRMQLDAPDQVNALLLDFLPPDGGPTASPLPDEYLLFELLCDGRYGLNQPASASRVAAAGVEGVGACPQ